jgi:hypothetical protein
MCKYPRLNYAEFFLYRGKNIGHSSVPLIVYHMDSIHFHSLNSLACISYSMSLSNFSKLLSLPFVYPYMNQCQFTCRFSYLKLLFFSLRGIIKYIFKVGKEFLIPEVSVTGALVFGTKIINCTPFPVVILVPTLHN